jgi:hypothetical protein
MTNYTASYHSARHLKTIGFPQQTTFYHHNKTKGCWSFGDISAFNGFLKIYTAAPVDAELDKYIPAGTIIKKTKNDFWVAEYNKIMSRACENPLDSKADLIKKLFREKLIDF